MRIASGGATQEDSGTRTTGRVHSKGPAKSIAGTAGDSSPTFFHFEAIPNLTSTFGVEVGDLTIFCGNPVTDLVGGAAGKIDVGIARGLGAAMDSPVRTLDMVAPRYRTDVRRR
jgi:hypothetical protein